MSLRILVADHDMMSCRALAETLRQAGHDVTPIASGEGAKAHLEKTAFDVVIADLALPGVLGLELLEFVKEHAPETIFIMISSDKTGEGEVEALDLGAFEFMIKPLDPGQLREVVEEAGAQIALRSKSQ